MKGKDYLDLQHPHWKSHWVNHPKLFTEPPSEAVKQAAQQFKEKGMTKILELGGGLGRDTLYLAAQGFQVYVLEYTKKGVETIRHRAMEVGMSNLILAKQHDLRNPLPFNQGCFDGCFSHILYCMAFTDEELNFLSQEIKRVLIPDGMNIYTARNTKDPMFGTGIHKGGNTFEIQGFVIHFFDVTMVKRLAKGYEILGIIELEEGTLPKRMYYVTHKSR